MQNLIVIIKFILVENFFTCFYYKILICLGLVKINSFLMKTWII